MPDWSERVDQLLFDGEEVETTVEVGTGTVTVTSHRVLVFTPGGDGRRYRAIDRPNVTGVERRGVSEFDLFPTAAKVGVVGAILALVGFAIDLETLIPRPDLSTAQGAGGAVDVVGGMLDVLYVLDDAALALGAGLVLVGVGLAAVQIATRSDRLVIEVAGGDDVLLSYSPDDPTLSDLEAAVAVPGSSDVPAS